MGKIGRKAAALLLLNGILSCHRDNRNEWTHLRADTEGCLRNIETYISIYMKSTGELPGRHGWEFAEALVRKYPHIKNMGYFRQRGPFVYFADSWEEAIRIKEDAYNNIWIYSIGPNRQDEGGMGDDISIKTPITELNGDP